MSKPKPTSEKIQCPHHTWRLFQRELDGVYYACGRKHGHGKNSLGTKDREQAIQELLALDDHISRLADEALAAAPAVGAKPKTIIGIKEGWDRYIDARDLPVHLGGLKPSSIRKYRTHEKRFVAHCTSKKIDRWSLVSQDTLEAYGKSLEGKLAPVTIHDDLTMEVSVSNWLIKKKLLPQDCKIDWNLPKPHGAEQYCYEADEVARMLDFSSSLTKNHWLHGLILLLSHTGVRVSKAIDLKWSDIDLKHEVIHIRDESFSNKNVSERRTVKSGKSRSIPIHQGLLQYLKSASRKTGYVLLGDQGRQLNYNHALDAFVRYVIKPLSPEFPTEKDVLGFKNGRFHSFRHFFVSECFAEGVPESDIQLWVGHSSSKILALYRHVRNDAAKASLRRVNFGSAQDM